MFKIGEFSRLTQVSIRMLRYYDEVGLLKPAKIDSLTNYRLYSTEQILLLNRIVFLRDLGFSVPEIFLAIESWSNESISALFDSKYSEIKERIAFEQSRLEKIEIAKSSLMHEKTKPKSDVIIKSIPSYLVLSLRRVVPSYYAEGMLWEEMTAFAIEKDISLASETFAIYHDQDYREIDVDIELCAPVMQKGEDSDGFTFRNTEPVALMACSMVQGPFENIGGAYQDFANWLHEHSQYKMGKRSRQIVHRGPWNESCSDDYLTEIQIPLRRVVSANRLSSQIAIDSHIV